MEKEREFLRHKLILSGIGDKLVFYKIYAKFDVPLMVLSGTVLEYDFVKIDDHSFAKQAFEGLFHEH